MKGNNSSSFLSSLLGYFNVFGGESSESTESTPSPIELASTLTSFPAWLIASFGTTSFVINDSYVSPASNSTTAFPLTPQSRNSSQDDGLQSKLV